VLSTGGGTYYGIKGSGQQIWESVQSPVRAFDIVEMLVARSGGARDVVERDVLRFLENLQEAGLLKIVESTT